VVKFAAEKAVFDAVHYTVKDALDGEGRPKAAEKPEKSRPSGEKRHDFSEQLTVVIAGEFR
jgi:hypothetical protein